MKKWNDEEVYLLHKLLSDGYSYEKIGIELNRSKKSVKEKCRKIGLFFNKFQKIIKYEKINCLECDKEFKSLINNERKFCTKSCSVKYSNKNRKIDYTKTKESNCTRCDKKIIINIRASSNKCLCDKCRKEKKKIYDSNRIPKKYKKEKNVIIRKERVCKKCNLNKLETKKQYCKECKYNYYQIYRPQCVFSFNLFDYPDEFDFNLIKEYGWYSPTNKNNNLNGVSRDHMLSVKEGFELGIDPKLLAHPANCRLMIHSENNIKNTKCSIAYDELLERIKNFENKYKNKLK